MVHDTRTGRSIEHCELHIGVATPVGSHDLAVLLAAAEAGESPVLDFRTNTDAAAFERHFQRLIAAANHRLVLRVEPQRAKQLADIFESHGGGHFDFLLLSCPLRSEDYSKAVGLLAPYATTVLCEVTSAAESEQALAAGATGLLIKGNESGGRVGSETTFVLLQRLAASCSVPLWVQGGLSPRTLAACRLAGASGAILDAQLALAQECILPSRLQLAIKAMDGGETVCVGDAHEAAFRVHRLFGRRTLTKLQELQPDAPNARETFFAELSLALASQVEDAQLVAMGQDGAFAATLAAKHRTVAGILRAYRRQSTDNLRLAPQAMALRENSPLAQAHGTRYPIVQGPMTRVSDVAAFASSVAQEGGLPFLALALSREAAAQKMLRETAATLGDAPWGVGILAFVPAELRAEQLRAVLANKPRFAILAGGRPDQAKQLDKAGITTYIHTPSPRLLEMFLRDGARRFVFEGRECGGHIGPLSSFVLWDLVLEVLLQFQASNSARESIDVIFAGGIHDALSAAMVATLAAQAADANIRIGVLIGTGYLFTHEAVEGGAIVPEFQEQALTCQETIILDSDGGHATRCAPTEFRTQFNSVKRALQQAGHAPEHVRMELEELNIGRLRMASKGLTRTTDAAGNSVLTEVPVHQQQAEGMYMIGQVAALRSELCTIQELHNDVSAGSCEILAELLDSNNRRPHAPPAATEAGPEPIAIVGMACLYPGAPDVSTYWQNILNRFNAIREVPPERWNTERFYVPERSSREYITSKWGGFIDPIAFDPMTFGIPPNSLQAVEPMHLLLLEVVRRALRDSGYDTRPMPRERTAVIVGSGGMPCARGAMFESRSQMAHHISQLPNVSVEIREQVIAAMREYLPPMTEDSFAGILVNVLAGRVANRFDFGGPNFTVDAACGSSLAALECAVKELRSGGSDVVVVGACDGSQTLFGYQLFSSVGALSPRGQCRPFDKSADGIAISDGVASIILKRLSDAVRDGDRIYSVIRHVAASSDGKDKSLTAPSVKGQRRALERAYAPLDIEHSHVGLMEAHGTGTVVGDRAELETMQSVFREHQVPSQQCALGSVKSLIGHTKNAAGLAGIIKCTLALHHRVLPPTLYDAPNPNLLDRTQPFYLLSRARPWFQSNNQLRIAGVSAFGFGGTNFHTVLEEYRPDTKAAKVRGAELMVFRAENSALLADQIDALRARIDKLRNTGLIEISAAVQRAAQTAKGNCRLAIVSTSIDELRQQLTICNKQLRAGAALPSSGAIAYASQPPVQAGGVALLFPGQGSHYVHMLEQLALNFDVVREYFEMAEAALSEILPSPLLGTIFPPPAYTPEEETEQRQRLSQTWYTQPALGAADYAMFALLTQLGVRADFAAGHSYGEYVALCAAGVLPYQDLIRLSEARGRVVHETQGDGVVAMLAVMLSREQLQPLVAAHPGVSIAIVNAPAQCTVGGKQAAVTAFEQHLQKSGIGHRRLPMSAGFHIPEAFAAAGIFARITAPLQFDAPCIPVFSGLTAEPYPADAGSIRRILLDQLTKTVRFKDQIEGLYQAGARTFIEVGPGNVLSGLAQQTLEGRDATVISTNRANSSNAMADLLAALGRLYVQGVSLTLEKLYAGCGLPLHTLDTLEPVAEPTSPLMHWVDTFSVRPVNAPVAQKLNAPVAQKPAEVKPVQVSAPAAVVSAPAAVAASNVAVAAPRAGNTALPNVMQEFLQEYSQREAEAQRARETLLNRFMAHQAELLTPAGSNHSGNGAVPLSPVSSRPETSGSPRPVQETVASRGSNGVSADVPAPAPARQPQATPPQATPALRVVAQQSIGFAATRSAGEDAQQADQSGPVLLQVVSDFTGYPREMLQLDQNMEADLGIDSIKRTEIFGALRERLQLQQDSSGGTETFFSAASRLRTLRDVAQWLDKQLEAAAPAPAPIRSKPVATEAIAAAAQPHVTPVLRVVAQQSIAFSATHSAGEDTRQAEPSGPVLLEVVSNFTGYPQEMLQLDQNMEADLGIDSIKRTEIFGALRERLQLQQDSSGGTETFFSAASRLRTLRDVAQWLDKQLEAAAPAPAPAPIRSKPAATEAIAAAAQPHVTPVLRVVAQQSIAFSATHSAGEDTRQAEPSGSVLLEVVSNFTGYPQEMLQLDQNMEADLGIDSIKRTEIFGALRERLQLQQDSSGGTETFFSAASRLRTLRDVAQWLDKQLEAAAPAPAPIRSQPAATDVNSVVVPASAAPVPVAQQRPSVSDAQSTQSLILEVVSQRTGYPREMLQLDQNMEADLGIDSIKRTEIFSALREHLPTRLGQDDTEAFFSATSRLRTLRELTQWIDEQLRDGSATELDSTAAPLMSAPNDSAAAVYELRPVVADDGITEAIDDAKRYVVRPRPADLAGLRPLALGFARENDGSEMTRVLKFVSGRQWGVVLITEDSTGRAAAMAQALPAFDTPARIALLRHAKQAGKRKFGCYEANLLSPQSLQEVRQLIRQDLGAVTDLWHLMSLNTGLEGQDSIEVRSLFALANVFGADVCAGHGSLIAVTEMDGALGVRGMRRFNPGQAAVPGLIKSLAQEWPAAIVRCWDTLPGTGPETVFLQAMQEFTATGDAGSATFEVAYSTGGTRTMLATEESPVDRTAPSKVSLNADSVILITGGARGIAAHVARKLTAEYGCTIIITGRSAEPAPESEQTAQLLDPTEIKRALAQQREVTLTPKELKSQFDRLMAAREMHENFASLRSAARHFEYHSLDVRDAQGLAALVEDIYRRHGRLDGVIHAAGIVDDTLVLNKSAAAFDAVYDTKVTPALTLTEVLRPGSLQFMVFFSSVAARFGCNGGADYAAANEVLNKLAWQLNRDWPGRVVSIAWGPWSDVGLATRYSEQMHSERGFGWLPIEVGCQRFVDELRFGSKQDAEVVIYVPNGTGPQEAVHRALAT